MIPRADGHGAEGGSTGEHDLAAGDFSPWLREVQAAIRGEGDSEVPCGGCTACCTSFQFVHIEPDEPDTLARIPPELLFPAPGRPRGHVLLGYDERGHCPMLLDDGCSIYEDRPRTCRAYDCRVFPATGVELDGRHADQAGIARRARRWRFAVGTPAAETELRAVRAAAGFLERSRESWPDGTVSSNPTQVAVLAIEVHEVFLGEDEATGEATVVEPDPGLVLEEVRRRRR